MTVIAIPKKKRHENPDLKRRVTEMPCTVCGRYPSDAHHVTTRGAGGGDTGDNLMPLCRLHHTQWHQIGPGKMIAAHPTIYDWLERHERADVIARAFPGDIDPITALNLEYCGGK